MKRDLPDGLVPAQATMTAPIVLFDPVGSVATATDMLERAVAAGAQSLLMLAADGNGWSAAQIDPVLRAQPVPLFGGVFPQVVHGGINVERGTVVCGLPQAVEVLYVDRLSDPEADYGETLSRSGDRLAGHPTRLVFVDGLARRVGALLDALFERFGAHETWIGGGAGSLSFLQRPCLFSNAGLVGDCAQLVGVPQHWQVGVEHGWDLFAGPFVVTAAQDNVIRALDYRPAFEVYREAVMHAGGPVVNADAFFDTAKGYPFGMEVLDRELLVRDPIITRGGELVCVGEVPVNSVVHILRGEPAHLIGAAARCARRVVTRGAPSFALLVDCISRVLFLQDRFRQELAAVNQALPAGAPLVGVLSLGEIANGGDQCLDFYNKTLVLAAAPAAR